MDIAEATAERLSNYYPFSTETIDTVSEFAGRQSRFHSYADFLQAVGLDQSQIVKPHKDMGHIHIVDRQPDEYDPAEALVFHLPMANPLDPNQLYQLGTIAGVSPNSRLIAAGNPGAPPRFGFGKLSAEQ